MLNLYKYIGHYHCDCILFLELILGSRQYVDTIRLPNVRPVKQHFIMFSANVNIMSLSDSEIDN